MKNGPLGGGPFSVPIDVWAGFEALLEQVG
jgi:hypothetical protein